MALWPYIDFSKQCWQTLHCESVAALSSPAAGGAAPLLPDSEVVASSDAGEVTSSVDAAVVSSPSATAAVVSALLCWSGAIFAEVSPASAGVTKSVSGAAVVVVAVVVVVFGAAVATTFLVVAGPAGVFAAGLPGDAGTRGIRYVD